MDEGMYVLDFDRYYQTVSIEAVVVTYRPAAYESASLPTQTTIKLLICDTW